MKYVFPKNFAGQFMVAEGLEEQSGAKVHLLNKLTVAIFEPDSLDVVRVYDSSGAIVGALLGTPVNYRTGQVRKERLDLDQNVAATDGLDEAIEEQVFTLGGSFIFLLDIPGAKRLYLDACGSLSAVFEPRTRRAAATGLQLLTPAESEARFDQELYEALNVLRDGWFPAGLTAHDGIERLMPNHYLDFDTFETHRHWPMQPISPASDPLKACGAILNSAGAVSRTLVRSAPVHVALTAGNETRMLLAANRFNRQEMEFVTVMAQGAELDWIRAGELARRFELPHRFVSVQEASDEEGWQWHARAGYAVGGPHIKTHPTVKAFESRPYFIGGQAGEVGRGFFWRPTDSDETPLDPEQVWARMGMPRHERALSAVCRWLESVQGLPGLLVLDLAYLEIRMGCWGFALSYTSPRPINIYPLISRESFVSMLALPPDWRRMKNGTNRMVQEVVKLGWPELLDLPISRYGDLRDWLSLVQRAIQNPHLVAKRLRKQFG